MRFALLVVVLAARSAAAQPACDPHEAAELRAHLTEARHNARTWNTVWGVAFTASAVGSFALAISDVKPELTAGAYVSGAKASVGALARWIMPLHVEVPEPSADPCADVAALRMAVTRAAKQERAAFYLGHVGGLAINAAGFVIIWKEATLGQAILSVAIGYPVGLLSNYTMPRSTWHLWRERDWSVVVVPPTSAEHAWLLTLGGSL